LTATLAGFVKKQWLYSSIYRHLFLEDEFIIGVRKFKKYIRRRACNCHTISLEKSGRRYHFLGLDFILNGKSEVFG
jgi:hypothetical protein